MLIANLPRMLGEIAARFIGQQMDMEVISSSTGKSQITPVQVVALKADVLIVASEDDNRALASRFVEVRPNLRVICVAEDGRSASCYFQRDRKANQHKSRMQLESEALAEEILLELDVDRMVEAIRGVANAG